MSFFKFPTFKHWLPKTENDVDIAFGNEGIGPKYVLENQSLAEEFGIDNVLGEDAVAVSDTVTGGNFNAPYFVDSSDSSVAPGGTVEAHYFKNPFCFGYDEIYSFKATGWNEVKNVSATVEGKNSIFFAVDNFVNADLDFSGVKNSVMLKVLDAKRGNYLTGNKNDIIKITSATNDLEEDAGWNDIHTIKTQGGHDKVFIAQGDEDLIDTTDVSFVDGSITIVDADLGNGNDYFNAKDAYTEDTVLGGNGKDKIFSGAGNDNLNGGRHNDVLAGGEDEGSAVELSAGLYDLIAAGDVLEGGHGRDTFIYKSGDGFDHVVDFENRDVLKLYLDSGDTSNAELATLQTDAGDLTGTMVTVNGEAAVFLEDYTNLSSVFV